MCIHLYEPGTWSLTEAASGLRHGDPWHDPVEKPEAAEGATTVHPLASVAR